MFWKYADVNFAGKFLLQVCWQSFFDSFPSPEYYSVYIQSTQQNFRQSHFLKPELQ